MRVDSIKVEPRLQIMYLLAVAVLAFVTSRPGWLLGLLGLQFALWLALGLPLRGLFSIVRKLTVFLVFIMFSCAFFEAEPGDQILRLTFFSWAIPFNPSSVVRGLLLSSRIVTVICASQILQRAGEGTAIMRGLRGLYVPASLAYSLDIVMALLGGADEPRRSLERDAGLERNRRRPEAEPEPHAAADGQGRQKVRRALRGDVSFLIERAQRNIARARERAEGYGVTPEAIADLAIITGLAVVSIGIRALHTLPGIPFAPGHKGVLTLPLYIVAHELTSYRMGATRLGVVIGLTSFLTGEGKFGIFEIVRHVTPGLFVDGMMPLVRLGGRELGPAVYALVGLGAAVTRLSTLLLVSYFVTAPKVFYAFLVPTLVSNAIFGLLSGFVTFHLMKSMQKLRAAL